MTLLAPILAAMTLFAGARVGIGTVFGSSSWDRHNPHDVLACYRPRRIDDSRDRVVAHRTLPCRSRVLVCALRSGRCVEATVGDRGPRRALVDLSRLVADAIGHNGRESVLLVPLPGPVTVAAR